MFLNIYHSSQVYPQVLQPEDLNSTPQVENEEHHSTVLHFTKASKNDKQNNIPAHHLLSAAETEA